MVSRRFLGDAPAQINRLEPATVFLAVLAQSEEYVSLQRILLGLQIADGRADEYPQDQFKPIHVPFSAFCLFIVLSVAVYAAYGRQLRRVGTTVGEDRAGLLLRDRSGGVCDAQCQRF